MSFCRPLLFPVHAPKFPRQQLFTRYRHALSNAATGTHTTGLFLRSSGVLRSQDTIPNTTSLPGSLSPLYIPKRALSKANTVAGKIKGHHKTSEYQEKRALDPKSVANLSPAVYLDGYNAAVQSEMAQLAEDVVSDILDVYAGSNSTRIEMLQQILSHGAGVLKHETVLRMLEYLNETSPRMLVPLLTGNQGGLARMMLDSAELRDTDRPFLRLFQPLLLQRLTNKTMPSARLKAINFKPPFLIYASFTTIHKLLSMSFHTHALDIFQALVELGYVPTEVLHNVDSSSDDPRLVVSMAIIRSCIHWNWHALAAAFTTDLIITHSPNKSITDLNIDVIYALLNTHPKQEDIRACGHLIRRIHIHSPVPDSVIRLFYNCAVATEAEEEAATLYAFTRSTRVVQMHRYPPPQDTALPWLLDHFANKSAHTHLARTLATEAVEENLWIPTPLRAQFITRIAALAYATQARSLWERYATGKDGALVAGNATLMVRLVSLFWNLHKTSLGKANAIRNEEGREADLERLQTTAEDAAVFAEHVRLAFASHHSPLAEAPHWHLTSLARASFIVGKISEGYQSLRYLLNRRESPDLYDANVALSAVAQLNPRLAVQMIERMTNVGLRPDGVSFGTALHYAVLQGDREVVDDMIERIRNLDNTRISLKTFSNLVHASIALGQQGSPEDAQKALANVLHLIKSFPELNMKSQTSTGKALVSAALRVNDGALAFNFWKLMLQKGAQWDDNEHQRLRHAIALLIQESELPLREHRDAMLMQLGKRTMPRG